MNAQRACEKMFRITNRKKNADQSYEDIQTHKDQEWPTLEEQKITSVNKDIEKLKHLCTVRRN